MATKVVRGWLEPPGIAAGEEFLHALFEGRVLQQPRSGSLSCLQYLLLAGTDFLRELRDRAVFGGAGVAQLLDRVRVLVLPDARVKHREVLHEVAVLLACCLALLREGRVLRLNLLIPIRQPGIALRVLCRRFQQFLAALLLEGRRASRCRR